MKQDENEQNIKEDPTPVVGHKPNGKSRMKKATQILVILALAVQATLGPLHASTVLYQTGFEAPGFASGTTGNGNLAGQGGWQSALSYSQNAAQVVQDAAGQAVEIFGPWVASNSPSFFNSDFTYSLSDYNPVAAGTPIVTVSADFWLSPGPTAAQASYVFAFLVLNDQDGNPFETVGIDGHGVVFGQNFASPNQVVAAPGTGTNTFHTLRADLDYTTRTVTFFMDAVPFGSMPFNPASGTLIGSVELVLQSSNPLDSSLLVDNVSVSAGAGIPANGCSIQITSAGPCTTNLAFGTPSVGDIYTIKAVYNVLGTPYQPFRIKYNLGNVTWYSGPLTGVANGYGFWDYFDWWTSLDGTLPWSITIDPDGVSGCTNRTAMTASGTFTPTPPSTPLNLYNPVILAGTEQATYSFQPGSGTIPFLHIIFGSPTSHGGQQVLSVTGPANAASLVTAPYGVPVFSANWTNVPAGLFQPSVRFVAQVNSMRVNPALLETNTWAQMSALPASVTAWLGPDQICQSTSPTISNFVSRYLPANYKTTMTPYDTARTLQKAVMRSLIYLEPPPYVDATNSLQAGEADCGGYASLLTAALRCAGIPARRIGGFWQCDTWQDYANWHVRTESYFPNTGWVITDACEGNAADPTGTYSWDFCFAPDANFFCAMDVGDQHLLPYYNFQDLQVTGWWWGGGAEFLESYDDAYLQPLCALSSPSAVNGSFDFSISNLPTDGTISLQASTNLLYWTTVATTNAASVTGNSLEYSFPPTGSPRDFFRVAQTP
jgi:hypothetical protein